MTRIAKEQLDNIITTSDKQGPDKASQTYSADDFDAIIVNTGDTDLLGYLLLDHYFCDGYFYNQDHSYLTLQQNYFV